MFKRKDWIHTKKGRGQLEETSSSSDDESLQEDLEVSSSEDDETSEEDLDEGLNDSELSHEDIESGESAQALVLDGEDDTHLDSEEAEHNRQSKEWYEAGKTGVLLRGRPLTCVPCARTKKNLLLNSVMLFQHIESAVHKRALSNGSLMEEFRFADDFNSRGVDYNAETHSERLQRVKIELAGTVDKSKKPGGKLRMNQKKRKTRPGKRQRAELKDKRAQQSSG
jgi:hypothetical protein